MKRYRVGGSKFVILALHNYAMTPNIKDLNTNNQSTKMAVIRFRLPKMR